MNIHSFSSSEELATFLAALDDSSTEARLQRIAKLTARALGAPVAQVNVVTAGKQVSLCSYGPNEWTGKREASLEYSYCQHVLASGEHLLIEDASQHPLVSENLATLENGICAYAAVPLEVAGGSAFGTLCVVDFSRRAWTQDDVELLNHVAEYVLEDLRDHAVGKIGAQQTENQYRTIFDQSPTGIVIYDQDLHVVEANPHVTAGLQIPPDGAGKVDLLRQLENAGFLSALLEPLDGESGHYEGPYTSKHSGVEVWVSVQTSPLLDGQGRIIGGIAIVQDLTELQRSEALLNEAKLDILERLSQAAEFRDDDTGLHTRRVGELSSLIAEELGLSSEEVELIRRTAPLHDVGKIGIPDSVLLKPGRLTEEEYEVMKTHSRIGGNILGGGKSDLLLKAEEIALGHHERWDGKGYPEGLAATEIPLAARIVAVADFYDALTHDRIYRPAWDTDRVLQEIRVGSGSQFDPDVVESFLRVISKTVR